MPAPIACPRSVQREPRAVEKHRPARQRIGAHDGTHEFGAARADDAGDAEDLAGMDREADIAEGAGGGAQLLDAQDLARGGWLRLGKQALDAAPDHVAQQHAHRHVGPLMPGNELAVAQHHDPVGDAGDLIQPVADIDERDALGLEPRDLREQPVGLAAAERRGWFVEDQQPRVQRQRLRDLHLLLRRDAECAHHAVGRNIEAEAQQLLSRPPAHRHTIDATAAHRLAAHEHVLGNREIGQQAHLLVDQTDPGLQRRAGRGGRVGAALEDHAAGVRLDAARDDRRQRGFARAVLAEQRRHLAHAHVEIHAVQHRHAGVGFGKAGDGEPHGAALPRLGRSVHGCCLMNGSTFSFVVSSAG